MLRKLFAQYAKGPALSQAELASCLAAHGCRGSASAYFNAFDRTQKKTWINQDDFVLGCAALDPLTPHMGGWSAERARAIFRFYTVRLPPRSLLTVPYLHLIFCYATQSLSQPPAHSFALLH